MPSSNNHRDPKTQGHWRYERASLWTAGLTLLVAALLGLLMFSMHVTTRNAQGQRRDARVVDIWRTMLNHLPAQAPGFLQREVLVALLIVAVVAFAYVLVATARLPRE
jgi:ABC-type uncharacterized transport system permease subunit